MPRPALVKFIGDENEYRMGHDGCEYHYCRECEAKSKCDKPEILQFSNGKNYHAFFVEYWQGVRDSLHVKGNDGRIDDFNHLTDFEIISDPDNVLNNHEAIVRCITHEFDDDFLELVCGKCYKAIGRDHNGMYLVMNESHDCYFYEPKFFEIVDDQHGILEKESVYYSFYGGGLNGSLATEDYIAAHTYSSNHKAALEKDRICGCFYCLKIFDPKEIEEWLDAENGDPLGTALCPYCGIDSVIGESSQYPITEQFLKKMKDYWF